MSQTKEQVIKTITDKFELRKISELITGNASGHSVTVNNLTFEQVAAVIKNATHVEQYITSTQVGYKYQFKDDSVVFVVYKYRAAQ